MAKTAVILQPAYLPWLGYFNQVAQADVFVFFDTVQYTRRDFRNRNKILTKNNESKWLTVPVKSKGNFNILIKDIEIDYSQKWQKSHLQQIKEAYRNCDFFNEIYLILESQIGEGYRFLSNLNMALTKAFSNYLELDTQFLIASEMDYDKGYNNASEHILHILKTLDCDKYLTGSSSVNYLDVALLDGNGFAVKFHQYKHPVYKQANKNFMPYLSVVDLLMRHGKQSLSIFDVPQIWDN